MNTKTNYLLKSLPKEDREFFTKIIDIIKSYPSASIQGTVYLGCNVYTINTVLNEFQISKNTTYSVPLGESGDVPDLALD